MNETITGDVYQTLKESWYPNAKPWIIQGKIVITKQVASYLLPLQEKNIYVQMSATKAKTREKQKSNEGPIKRNSKEWVISIINQEIL